MVEDAAEATAPRPKTRFCSRNIFYSWTRHEHFPATHLLLQHNASRRGAAQLLQAIFGSVQKFGDGRVPARFRDTVAAFQELLSNFRTVDRQALLRKCCPILPAPKAAPAPADTEPDTQAGASRVSQAEAFCTQFSEIYAPDPCYTGGRWKASKRRARNIAPPLPMQDATVAHDPDSYNVLIQQHSSYAHVARFLQVDLS